GRQVVNFTVGAGMDVDIIVNALLQQRAGLPCARSWIIGEPEIFLQLPVGERAENVVVALKALRRQTKIHPGIVRFSSGLAAFLKTDKVIAVIIDQGRTGLTGPVLIGFERGDE